ncbi:MAG: hypothetical protein ACOC1O_06390, partial [bacterium]
MTKKIFILGAGASKPVGIPMQASLISEIFSLNKEEDLQEKYKGNTLHFLDSQNDLLSQFNIFNGNRKIFAEFLIDNFTPKNLKKKLQIAKRLDNSEENQAYQGWEEKQADQVWNDIFNQLTKIDISLENIFTIIDKAIGENCYFQNYSIKNLKKVQFALDKCLIYILSYYTPDKNKLYEKISQSFVEEAKNGKEPVIITLNWDTILDYFLFDSINGKETIVDYCTDCYNINDGKILKENYVIDNI